MMSDLPVPTIVVSPPTPPASPPVSPAPTPSAVSPPTAETPTVSLPTPPVEEDTASVTAASTVYHIPELRQLICEAAGLRELVKVMKLERINLQIVIPMLYRRVPEEVARAIKKDHPRRIQYCNAIRSIDLSPPTHPLAGQELYSFKLRDSPKRQPIPFNRIALSRKLPGYKRKYPGIITVINRYPTIEGDQGFVAHLDAQGALESVEIESLVRLNINNHFVTSALDVPTLPDIPVHLGLVISQTIVIRLVDGEGADRSWRKDTVVLGQRLAWWSSWLFNNGGPDGRITGTDQQHLPARLQMELGPDQALLYLSQRGFSAPISHFTLYGGEGITSAKLVQLLEAIGSDLRVLNIHRSYLESDDIRPTLLAISRHFPLLEVLHIGFASLSAGLKLSAVAPLQGLQHLRTFSASGHCTEEKGMLALYVCGLGSPGCVFLDPALIYKDGDRTLASQVMLARRLVN